MLETIIITILAHASTMFDSIISETCTGSILTKGSIQDIPHCCNPVDLHAEGDEDNKEEDYDDGQEDDDEETYEDGQEDVYEEIDDDGQEDAGDSDLFCLGVALTAFDPSPLHGQNTLTHLSSSTSKVHNQF